MKEFLNFQLPTKLKLIINVFKYSINIVVK